MARTLVVDVDEGTKFPFLRGILTRSLQEAGLSFSDAYRLASDLRDSLRNVPHVTTDDLRARVLKQLEPFGTESSKRYLQPPRPASITVLYSNGQSSPFSRGRHRLGLASCGLTGDEAALASGRIYDAMVFKGLAEITSSELRHLTYKHLVSELGDEAAQHYLVWQEFKRSNRPLVVLIGGGVGSGKSTVAAQVAHRLEIVRIQSTDMLREVMRVMVPEDLLPVLHTSTFKAWQKLSASDRESKDRNSQLIDGYLTQSDLVSTASRAVLSRAMRERVSLILEGVHAHAGLVEDFESTSDAIVLRVVLGVFKPSQLKARIKGRGKKVPDRRAKRYLEHFDAIWALQSYMLSEADQAHVPIVSNDVLEETVHRVMGLIMERLCTEYSGSPEEVF